MYTVDQVKEHLNVWLEADLAVSKGQSYKIGDRSLTRADVSLIMQQIRFWRDELDRLSPENAYPRTRAYRVIPYD